MLGTVKEFLKLCFGPSRMPALCLFASMALGGIVLAAINVFYLWLLSLNPCEYQEPIAKLLLILGSLSAFIGALGLVVAVLRLGMEEEGA